MIIRGETDAFKEDSAGSFRLRIDKALEMAVKEKRTSEKHEIGKLLWTAAVEMTDPAHLVVYIEADWPFPENSTSWSASASVSFTVLAQKGTGRCRVRRSLKASFGKDEQQKQSSRRVSSRPLFAVLTRESDDKKEEERAWTTVHKIKQFFNYLRRRFSRSAPVPLARVCPVDPSDPYRGAFNGDSLLLDVSITIHTFQCSMHSPFIELFPRSGEKHCERKSRATFASFIPFVADQCLVVAEKQFYVSRALLALHSVFFRNLFYGEFITRHEQDVYKMPAKVGGSRGFEEFLRMLYEQSRAVHADTVELLLRHGDFFIAENILRRCSAYLVNPPPPFLLSSMHRLSLAGHFGLREAEQTIRVQIEREHDRGVIRFLRACCGGVASVLIEALPMTKEWISYQSTNTFAYITAYSLLFLLANLTTTSLAPSSPRFAAAMFFSTVAVVLPIGYHFVRYILSLVFPIPMLRLYIALFSVFFGVLRSLTVALIGLPYYLLFLDALFALGACCVGCSFGLFANGWKKTALAFDLLSSSAFIMVARYMILEVFFEFLFLVISIFWPSTFMGALYGYYIYT